MQFAKSSAICDQIEKLIWLLVGACIAYAMQRVLAWANEKHGKVQTFRRNFRGFPDFHKNLFYKNLSPAIWNTQVPARLRDHWITYVFLVKAIGRAVIKDLRITVDAKNGSGIVTFKFLVPKTVICDRLKTEQIEDKRLIADWKYVNPAAQNKTIQMRRSRVLTYSCRS